MTEFAWVQEFPGAITVCDPRGMILALNAQARQTYAKSGGADLLGANLLDCHPEPARTRLRQLLAEPRVNAYTIDKAGVKKWIYQAPWYQAGQYAGLVELALEVPFELPHFVRASS